MTSTPFIGQSVLRKEDRRLLTGRGKFIADLQRPGMLQVAFARSPIAHGRIRRIDTSAALAAPGVATVITAADFRGELVGVPGMQNRPPARWREQVQHQIDIPDTALLAGEVVRYVGEPYALVVAETLNQALDAVEAIVADIEPLAAITSIDEALAPGAPAIHASAPDNVTATFSLAHRGAIAASEDAHRIRRRFVNHRYCGSPMECRGVIAEYDGRQDTLMIWSACQVVHWVRREVAKQLRIPEGRIRCQALDVGGGFGVKGHVYPEDILIPWLARRLDRPVAWIETRQEHLIHSTHSRDDRQNAEIRFDDHGRILSLDVKLEKDTGAYTPVGIGSLSNSATHMCGIYVVPSLAFEAKLVVTNKAPNAPYRGAGRPEACFTIERLMDLVARELKLDPIEVRRRNLVTPDRMPHSLGIPYRDGAPSVYDGGDFPATFEMALDAVGGLEVFRAEQQAARRDGRYLGLGVAGAMEATGAGPFEGATIRIDAQGHITAATGACSQGQGHETVFAQVAADEWGVRPEDVTVLIGDTDVIAHGYGTIASRSAVNSSAAIRMASTTLRKKVFDIAAGVMECASDDLELADGAVRLRGVPGRALTLREIALHAAPGSPTRPAGISAGLEATEYFEPPTVTWAHSIHAVTVEVDAETGDVQIQRYAIAHDAGVILNPMIADGQILGGAVQGIGGVLFERIVYDANGQPLAGSLLDYALPTAASMPSIEIRHRETPSKLNELGVKGLGEGAIIGPPAAIVNAICDALSPLGFEWNTSFVDRFAIVKALQQGK